MDWETPRTAVVATPTGAPRPLFQLHPRDLAVHGVVSLPRALAASAGIFALLMGLYLAMPTRYAAKAVLTVDPRLTASTDDFTPGIGRDSVALESLSEVAVTDRFLLALARSEKLTADPEFASSAGDVGTVEKLRSAITVDRLGTTYVFEVGARARSADKAARIANAVATALVEHVGDERNAVNSTAARRLADQVESLRTAVALSEKAAADYRARLGLVDAGRDANAAERTYSDLSRQVADAGNALQTAKSRLDELAKSTSPEAGGLDAVGSPLLTTLRARIADLHGQIAEMQGIFGTRHPQILRLQDRLAETRQQLATEAARLKTVAKADYDVAKRRYESLSDELAAAKVSVAGVGTASADLSTLELKAKADRDAYEAALTRYQRAAASNHEPEIEMRLTSEALPPIRPTKRTIGFVAPIAAGLALPLGFLAAMGMSVARSRVRTASDVESLLDIPVVGVVPRTGKRFGLLKRLVVDEGSLEDCATLIGRVATARPGATVMVADLGTQRGAATRVGADLVRLLGAAGFSVAVGEPAAPSPPPAAEAPARRGWRRLGRPEAPVAADLPASADIRIVSVGPTTTPQAARTIGATTDAAVLLLPWNALSSRDLRQAVNALLPDPRTPAMVVFTI